MSEREFEAYLNLLARTLKLSDAQRQRIAGELRDHLEERLEDLTERGVDRDAAILAALDEFGDAHVLAHDLTVPQTQLRRRKLMQTGFATVAAAALVALAVTYLLPTNRQGTAPQSPAHAQTEETVSLSIGSEPPRPEVRTAMVDLLPYLRLGLDAPGLDVDDLASNTFAVAAQEFADNTYDVVAATLGPDAGFEGVSVWAGFMTAVGSEEAVAAVERYLTQLDRQLRERSEREAVRKAEQEAEQKKLLLDPNTPLPRGGIFGSE
ncbi:MAG: permease prefix domain 1-containing protein [Planctomycetota bacterium]